MIIDEIIKKGLLELSSKANASYRIDNIILGKSIYTMKNSDRVFNDINICLVILEQGYGFAYFQSEFNFESFQNFVNRDLREILKTPVPPYLKVAIADAIYSVLNNLNKRYRYKNLRGELRTKARQRAKVLVEEIPIGSKVLLLGASSEIIEECNNKNMQLTVLDLEPTKIGLEFSKIIIEDSAKLLEEKIEKAEYIIATGMIFVSESADTILNYSRINNRRLILYMETGSNFGRELLDFGAYRVLSEIFPYYDFSGDTKYFMHKKKVISFPSLI